MTGRDSYEVVVTREGPHWLADVPELDGVSTHARNLPSLLANVREAIALASDLPDGAEAELALTLTLRTGDDVVDDATADVRALRERIDELKAELAESTQQAVGALVARGLSVRDVGVLLGVSHQRVHQLVS